MARLPFLFPALRVPKVVPEFGRTPVCRRDEPALFVSEGLSRPRSFTGAAVLVLNAAFFDRLHGGNEFLDLVVAKLLITLKRRRLLKQVPKMLLSSRCASPTLA